MTSPTTTMTTVSGSQRLRTLEKNIRKASEQIQTKGLSIGRWLVEIRDDQLWKEDFDSWGAYLHDRVGELVGKSFAQASKLICAAEVAKRLPDALTGESTPRHLVELSRLAPRDEAGSSSNAKDYSALRKEDVARVLQYATELAGGEAPTAQQVRKAVDHDLGIDRAAKAAETKEQKSQGEGIDLRSYIDGKIGVLEAILETLGKVPDAAWERFNEDNPRTVKRLTTELESLTAFVKLVSQPTYASFCPPQ